MKKTFSMLMAVCICFFSFSIIASATNNPNFYCQGLTGNVGDTVTVIVGVDGSYQNVGGLNLSLTFNTAEMTYVDGSRKTLCSTMKNGDLNTDQSAVGKVSFLWSSESGAAVSGNIASFQFVIVKSSESLRIKIMEMFKNDASFTNLIDSVIVINPSPDITENAAVASVISKISAIGTVENTDACKQKITQARQAYNELTYAERKLVTNYSVLTAAEMQYQAVISGSSDSAASAASFRAANSGILAKTTATVTTEDETALQNALNEWNNLSANAKILVVSEKNLLNSLKTKIESLKADYAEQQEIINEAKGFLIEFKSTYSALLAVDYDEIDENYYEAYYTALNSLDEYCDMNAEFENIASEQIAIIKKNYSRALQKKTESEKISDPSVEEAALFRSKYGWILGMEVGSVSNEDIADLSVAAYAFSTLSDGAKSLLPNAQQHISSLLTAAESQTPEREVDTVTSTVYKDKIINNTIEKTVEVPVEKEVISAQPEQAKVPVLLNTLIPGLNPAVWWLIGSTGVSLILCGAFIFMYMKTRTERGDT